jgi:hypothetical protein
LKDCCCKECTESKDSILGSIEGFPQGVRAIIFPKGLEDFSIKIKRASALKCQKEAQRCCLLVDNFCEGVLVHFEGVVKEALDSHNSPWRIHEVPEAIRSCRGAGELRQVFSKCKLRRNQTMGSKSTMVVGSLT